MTSPRAFLSRYTPGRFGRFLSVAARPDASSIVTTESYRKNPAAPDGGRGSRIRRSVSGRAGRDDLSRTSRGDQVPEAIDAGVPMVEIAQVPLLLDRPHDRQRVVVGVVDARARERPADQDRRDPRAG